MKTLKVILIGAGGRGRAYTDLMQDERFKVVAVAEPVDARRNYIKELHNIPEEMCFTTWEPLLDLEKFADIAIISTMDRMHFAPAMKAIEQGYDLLLEKPATPTPEECVEIEKAAKAKGVKILVCHVLRYSPFFMALKSMIDEGLIGRVMSIHHAECVGNTHQSHSFVRGNWGNSDESSSMILQKSCHDMDVLQWLVGKSCKKVQSFGSLTYFTRENAPEGSPEHCDKTCPEFDTCPYNAVKLYMEDKTNGWFRSAATQKIHSTDEEVAEALKNTQYGKCVFKCNNNVVDHQVVNLEFEDGTVASFNMCAFNKGGRYIRIMGTEGELYGSASTNEIEYFNFKTRQTETIQANDRMLSDSIVNGHGGGDSGIINALYDYIAEGKATKDLSEIEISVKNHMIAFAAEKSRVEGTIVDLDEFTKDFK
ncbi:MAG: Gfo/Idh/MocA family oxidoreductase [Clostridia bacterium]|nr:Gfo/Idh/MocA family oxidoreductase [Clostridia bacterium]